MQGFILVLALAALPAAGNLLGGIASEVVDVSERVISLALHAAAGVVLAVGGLELMPAAQRATPAWIPILAFVGGGVLFIGIERRSATSRGAPGSGAAPPARWRSSPASHWTCSATAS
ncbi:MAG: hypothetical protein M3P83_06820 [Actinomycetota bacterium]|nr:hypothetical protein [Actinomycetota bacterium]